MNPNMENLPTEALEQVAGYFQALSEPTRLQILSLLREGERNVGELAQACGYTSANISRHLAVLAKHGLVARDSRGLVGEAVTPKAKRDQRIIMGPDRAVLVGIGIVGGVRRGEGANTPAAPHVRRHEPGDDLRRALGGNDA